MTNQCTDRDLLAVEPGIFTAGGFNSQRLAQGTDGQVSGTTFTSLSADFISAGIEPAMVLCLYTTIPTEATCYEIISVDSATMLTISLLRTDTEAPPLPPPPASELKYFINTFRPQIAAEQAELEETLRRLTEAEPIAPADFVDSRQMRSVVVFGTLARIFTARASGASSDDANWIKADFYRRQHIQALGRLRLTSDIDGDGKAEHTRDLSNINLRRI